VIGARLSRARRLCPCSPASRRRSS
jgi:hypothetical protein